MGWINLDRLGGWFEKEAVPFVRAGVRGTLAGGPYMGIVSAITATNERGGNPLGKVGRECEKIVQPVVQITETVNIVNKVYSAAAEEAVKKATEEEAKVVLC